MPSKRQIARAEALTRSKDMRGFLEELGHETDRAAAILGAALLDELIYQLICAFLIDDAEEVQNLTDTERPLGAFGARIRAAYCMGLITKEIFKDLNVIKLIRNLFAHRLHGLSFSEESIANECAKLKCLERIHLVGADLSSARVRFSSAIYLIHIYLSMEIKLVSHYRCQTPEAKAGLTNTL